MKLITTTIIILYMIFFSFSALADNNILESYHLNKGNNVWLKQQWNNNQQKNMTPYDIPALTKLNIKNIEIKHDIFGNAFLDMVTETPDNKEIKSLFFSYTHDDKELIENIMKENFYTEDQFNNLKIANNTASTSPQVIQKEEKKKNNVQIKNIGLNQGDIVYNKTKLTGILPLTKLRIKNISINHSMFGSASLDLIFETFDTKEVKSSFSASTNNDNELVEKVKSENFYTEKQFNNLGWSKKTIKAIQNGEVFIGMTKEQVEASWGLPEDINRTTGSWGVHEQWVYREQGSYLYFENGKLTSWQD